MIIKRKIPGLFTKLWSREGEQHHYKCKANSGISHRAMSPSDLSIEPVGFQFPPTMKRSELPEAGSTTDLGDVEVNERTAIIK